MRSINYLIVELEDAYNNEVVLNSGDSLIVNSTIESVAHINRVATVKSAPSFTILRQGDKVVIHHNIFRLRNSTKGNTVDSDFYIGDNKYFVPLTEVFMYKRGDSDWVSIDPYCFIKPIIKEEEDSKGFNLLSSESSFKGRLDKVGIVAYPSKELTSQGVKKGDKVRFSKNSEYEFEVEGELYYKMSTKDVLAVI